MNTPKGVKRVERPLADGSIAAYYYHRRSGVRLPGAPGEKAFEIALRLAERGRTPERARPESLDDLVKAFRASIEWKRCGPKTRKDRERLLREAVDRMGFLTVADLNDRSVRGDLFAWRDDLAETPKKADAALAIMRRMIGWAYDRGFVEVNHARDLGRLYKPGQRRDKVWTADLERAFLAAASPAMRRLYLFALYTTARESDIAHLSRLNPALLADGWLSFQPSKTTRSTGLWVHLPVSEFPPLAELLAESTGEILLATKTGKAWTAANIRRQFALTMDAAKIKADIHFNDIRGTGASRMEEAGCTSHEVSAITGHLPPDVSQTGLGSYSARSRALARNAYRKWWAAMSGEGAQNVVAIDFGKRAENGK